MQTEASRLSSTYPTGLTGKNKDYIQPHACAQLLSHIQLFTTAWIAARSPLLSMEISRQEYWSGLPFPLPGDLPNPVIELVSPALAVGFFTTKPPV